MAVTSRSSGAGSGAGPALVVTAAAAAWALAQQALVPGVVLVLPLVAGAAFSWRRWGRGRSVRPEAVAAGVALLILVSGALTEVDRTPAMLAGFLAIGVVPLSFDWTSPDRARLSLLVTLVLQVAATSDLALGSAALRLLIWAGLAATAMVLLHDRDRAEVAPLAPSGTASSSGTAPPASSPGRRRDRRRVAVDVAVVVAIVAMAAAVIPQLDLSPPQSAAAETGDQSGGDRVAPYLGFSDQLDTTRRGKLGDEVVLRVQSAAPDFWRGQTFDAWDGRVWRRDLAESGEPMVLTPGSGGYAAVQGGSGLPASAWVPPSPGDPGYLTGLEEPLVQRFEVVAASSDLVFGAYRVAEVDVASQVLLESDGALRALQPLGQGTTYTVTSERSDATPARLRAAGAVPTDLSPSIADDYLALGEVPDRVEALARDVTAEAPTTYDKVRALEAWMGANTTYTLDIPPLPPGADAVEQHLFVDRRGFCEQIGTSLVVMLRTLGIPARLAVGYVPSEESLLGGEFTVRADDAHAWAEVYFPGVGWQGFDPTASVPLSGEHDDSFLAAVLRLLQRLGPVVLVLVAGAVAVALVLATRAASAWWRQRQARPWATVYFRRLERAGVGRGRPHWPHETPREYVTALVRSALPDPRLLAVGDLVTEAVWSGRAPAPAQRAWAEAVLAEATKRWPADRPWRRRR